MTRKYWVATAVCLCMAATLFTGCRSKGDGGLDGLEGTQIRGGGLGGDGDSVLPPVGALGPRVETSLENILFDFDSAQIKSSEQPKIEEAAKYIKANTKYTIVLEGHCDERGTLEYNMSLGERRGEAVRAYLIGLGIDGSSLTTKSYGEESPLDPGHDETAWQKNRRVEVAVYE